MNAMPPGAGTGTIDAMGARRCSSPFCDRRIAAGEPALKVSATWLRDTDAITCFWPCLAAWAQLMSVGARAHAAGEATMCQIISPTPREDEPVNASGPPGSHASSEALRDASPAATALREGSAR